MILTLKIAEKQKNGDLRNFMPLQSYNSNKKTSVKIQTASRGWKLPVLLLMDWKIDVPPRNPVSFLTN